MSTLFHPCNDCDCSSQAIRSARGCPRTFAITKPDELAPPREERNVAGTCLVIAVAVTFGGICLCMTLALAFAGWR